MKVGLLQCDHVSEQYRSIAGDYDDMFGALFGADLELVPYDAINGDLPASPDECDAYVCTGSRHSVYEDLDWISELAAFVRDVHQLGDIRFVGICFGHQLLAHALGGRVEKAATGWGAGVRSIDVTQDEPWMDPPLRHVDLHFMHQDQVTELPSGAAVLGKADHCPIAMFGIGTTMVGIQAHPEFVPAYTDALLAGRVARIGEAAVAEAQAGLTQPTDEAAVARWIHSFFVGR